MASRVLDKKLKKVLDMRTDTPALLESLEAISTLFSDHSNNSSAAAEGGVDGEKAGGGAHEYSTLDARRSLREDLERQVRLALTSVLIIVAAHDDKLSIPVWTRVLLDACSACRRVQQPLLYRLVAPACEGII